MDICTCQSFLLNVCRLKNKFIFILFISNVAGCPRVWESGYISNVAGCPRVWESGYIQTGET